MLARLCCTLPLAAALCPDMKPPLHPAAPEQPPRAHPNRRLVLRGALAGVGALGGLALSGCAEPPAEAVALGYGGVLSMRLSPDGEQALVCLLYTSPSPRD